MSRLQCFKCKVQLSTLSVTKSEKLMLPILSLLAMIIAFPLAAFAGDIPQNFINSELSGYDVRNLCFEKNERFAGSILGYRLPPTAGLSYLKSQAYVETAGSDDVPVECKVRYEVYSFDDAFAISKIDVGEQQFRKIVKEVQSAKRLDPIDVRDGIVDNIGGCLLSINWIKFHQDYYALIATSASEYGAVSEFTLPASREEECRAWHGALMTHAYIISDSLDGYKIDQTHFFLGMTHYRLGAVFSPTSSFIDLPNRNSFGAFTHLFLFNKRFFDSKIRDDFTKISQSYDQDYLSYDESSLLSLRLAQKIIAKTQFFGANR